jgi:hypothetical protein
MHAIVDTTILATPPPHFSGLWPCVLDESSTSTSADMLNIQAKSTSACHRPCSLLFRQSPRCQWCGDVSTWARRPCHAKPLRSHRIILAPPSRSNALSPALSLTSCTCRDHRDHRSLDKSAHTPSYTLTSLEHSHHPSYLAAERREAPLPSVSLHCQDHLGAKVEVASTLLHLFIYTLARLNPLSKIFLTHHISFPRKVGR